MEKNREHSISPVRGSYILYFRMGLYIFTHVNITFYIFTCEYNFFIQQNIRVRASLRCGPWARHIYPSLVLVQPRKTRPYITERLLMGRKESNQTNKQTNKTLYFIKILPYFLEICYEKDKPSAAYPRPLETICSLNIKPGGLSNLITLYLIKYQIKVSELLVLFQEQITNHNCIISHFINNKLL